MADETPNEEINRLHGYTDPSRLARAEREKGIKSPRREGNRFLIDLTSEYQRFSVCSGVDDTRVTPTSSSSSVFQGEKSFGGGEHTRYVEYRTELTAREHVTVELHQYYPGDRRAELELRNGRGECGHWHWVGERCVCWSD